MGKIDLTDVDPSPWVSGYLLYPPPGTDGSVPHFFYRALSDGGHCYFDSDTEKWERMPDFRDMADLRVKWWRLVK